MKSAVSSWLGQAPPCRHSSPVPRRHVELGRACTGEARAGEGGRNPPPPRERQAGAELAQLVTYSGVSQSTTWLSKCTGTLVTHAYAASSAQKTKAGRWPRLPRKPDPRSEASISKINQCKISNLKCWRPQGFVQLCVNIFNLDLILLAVCVCAHAGMYEYRTSSAVTY